MTTTLTGLEPLIGKRVAIYIPAYNCEATIGSVLRRIPKMDDAAAFILDNCSADNTSAAALREIRTGTLPIPTVLARSTVNHGYAGSQKAAYGVLREIPSVEWVVMLHGDGQYDPALIERLKPLMSTDADVVYGYRSKREKTEETPLLSYIVIKVLSMIESLITGHFRKEWHSGFVMYNTRFLRKVDFNALTTTPHFDGNMLFVAGLMKAKIVPVVIYKRYRELTAFEGAARRQYVIDVFKLMWKFRQTAVETVTRKLFVPNIASLPELLKQSHLQVESR